MIPMVLLRMVWPLGRSAEGQRRTHWGLVFVFEKTVVQELHEYRLERG